MNGQFPVFSLLSTNSHENQKQISTSEYPLRVGGLMEQRTCNRLPLLPQHCCNTPRAHYHMFLHHNNHTQVTLIYFESLSLNHLLEHQMCINP